MPPPEPERVAQQERVALVLPELVPLELVGQGLLEQELLEQEPGYLGPG